jgi:hypothetical protein
MRIELTEKELDLTASIDTFDSVGSVLQMMAESLGLGRSAGYYHGAASAAQAAASELEGAASRHVDPEIAAELRQSRDIHLAISVVAARLWQVAVAQEAMAAKLDRMLVQAADPNGRSH